MSGRAFRVDGETYSLADMLEANEGDDEACDWCEDAQPGDVRDDMHAERIECVDASEQYDRDERAALRQWQHEEAVREASR